MNKSKRICELIGLCNHEQKDPYTLECKHCGESMLFPWQRGYDFTTDSGRVNLLRLMMAREDWDAFLAYLYVIQFDDSGMQAMATYITEDGPLVDACIEWLEKVEK